MKLVFTASLLILSNEHYQAHVNWPRTIWPPTNPNPNVGGQLVCGQLVRGQFAAVNWLGFALSSLLPWLVDRCAAYCNCESPRSFGFFFINSYGQGQIYNALLHICPSANTQWKNNSSTHSITYPRIDWGFVAIGFTVNSQCREICPNPRIDGVIWLHKKYANFFNL